jgi:hypothetical protein
VVVNLDDATPSAPALPAEDVPVIDDTDPRSPVAPVTPSSLPADPAGEAATPPEARSFVSKMTPPPVADEVTQSEPPARVGSESAVWRNEAGGDWFDVGEDPSSFTDHLAEREAQAHQASSGIPAGAKVLIAVMLLIALALLVAFLANKGA